MKTLTVMQVSLMCVMGIAVARSDDISRSEIMKGLELDPGGKTEVVKEFPDSFPEVLTARSKPLVYTKDNSENFEYIGMPIGGICAGQLYLGGDGKLWFWDIFNINFRRGQLKGEEAYEFPYARSKPDEAGARMIEQGFSIRVKSGDRDVTKNLDRNGIKEIEFLGQYPIGEVTYRDPELPVEVKMEAFSPFIPLDLENSILPATVMRFTVKNTSAAPVEAELAGWLENAVLTESRKTTRLEGRLVNRITKIPGNGLRLECSALQTEPRKPAEARPDIKALPDFGTMSLSLFGGSGTSFASPEGQTDQDLTIATPLVSQIGRRLRLQPGAEKRVNCILTWYFPTTLALRGRPETRYYAKRFESAVAVSDYLIKNFDELTGATRLWRDTWYDSTLPYWFLDRSFLNTSILASSTSNLLRNRLFYGWEGDYQGPGTCTHVWGYVHAMGRLFPALEKSLREQVDLRSVSEGGALEDDGIIKHRWFSHDLAVDGQAGCILKAYLCHQMSKDDAFLKRIYPGLKKAMQGLTEARDADHDGILTGAQHNTLDAAWYGKVTWLSLHYTAALRAAAEMADEMGDHEYALFCRATADKGRKYIEDELFNGEYFFHQADPDKPDSPGTYTGLEYSQLLGQSWAYQVGMGEIVDPVKARTALESMWRYNFTTDVGPFREVHKGGRWYAMPGEGGLIACTWPRGGSEVLLKGNRRFADYNNECQNGYEYAATSLMMWHGMPYHSLAHIWYLHNDRYHASKRNPWCEIEWGLHYSRSMASYGHFTAACGFEYHGPKGHIGFAPRVSPDGFKSPFVGAEGWGTFSQQDSNGGRTALMLVRRGRLRVKTMKMEVAQPPKAVDVKVAGRRVPAEHTVEGKRLLVTLLEAVTLNEGQKIVITTEAPP